MSRASLRLVDGHDYLELQRLAVCDVEHSLQLSVEVSFGDFRGAEERIYLFQDDGRRFIAQLKELDRSRRGSARLESIGPEEFWLEVLSTDRLGHLAAQGQLAPNFNLRPRFLRSCVGFRFPLDPSTFSALRLDFQSVLCPS